MFLFCSMETNLYIKQEITPIDLLFRVHDFIKLSPDENKWDIKNLENNDPRLYRYKQILSILQAYGFENKTVKKYNYQYHPITYFYEGYFLRFDYNDEKRFNTDYNSLIKELKEEQIKAYKAEKRKYKDSEPDLFMIFRELKSYSLEVYDLLHYHWDDYSAPPVTEFYQHHIVKAESFLKKSTFKINKILAKLIDPSERAFNKAVLIREYDFPNVDIIELDIENY